MNTKIKWAEQFRNILYIILLLYVFGGMIAFTVAMLR